MLQSSLCDYGNVYILVKGTITLVGQGATEAAIQANRNNEQVIFKNCAPFTDCITEINNTQVDNVKDLDVVMRMYNLMEYSDNYSRTSGSLWQYHKNEPTDPIDESNSFKFKARFLANANNRGIIKAEIDVPLKYF